MNGMNRRELLAMHVAEIIDGVTGIIAVCLGARWGTDFAYWVTCRASLRIGREARSMSSES